jgi:hypothetical protein
MIVLSYYFLFLEKKKVTKENSRQTRMLRRFAANAQQSHYTFNKKNLISISLFGFDLLTIYATQIFCPEFFEYCRHCIPFSFYYSFRKL